MNLGTDPKNSDKKKVIKKPLEILFSDTPTPKTSRLAIASIICAIAAIISVVLFCLSTFAHVRVLEGFFVAVAVLFSHIAFLLGVIAIGIIVFCHRELKGFWYAILAIFLAAPFIFAMVSGIYVDRVRAEGVKTAKGKRLSWAVVEYAKNHDGYLPAADKWCDLLIEYDKRLSKNSFKYSSSKDEVYNYAFNRNLNGLRIDDIPSDTVLLFESEGGWNLTGTEELLKKAHEDRQYVYVISDGQAIKAYNMKRFVNSVFRWKHNMR